MKTAVFLALVFGLTLPAAAQRGEYQMRRVVLDAGHGGSTIGASAGGRREQDIVLDIALRVGRLIDENLPDVEVIYTRKTDVEVGLEQRAAIANRADADLFLSIHADATGSSSVRGSSSWVMGLSREKENLELAMRENSVITYEADYQTKYQGFDPADPASYIMFAVQQSVHLDQSIALAALLQKHYGSQTSIPVSRGVRQQIFVVLHKTTMPAVLTEIGFLTNASDRAYMSSENGKNRIARSIFNAISEYKSAVEGNARIIALDPSGEAPAPALTAEADGAPVFRVQVSASRTPVARGRFGDWAGEVDERRIGSYYKYFVGETPSWAEALALQRRARRTFRDAFIVPFVVGEPVELTDEMQRE